MPLFGSGGLIRQSGARYAFERNGRATFDVQYRMSTGNDAILEQGDTAEGYSNVVLVSGSITHVGISGCDDILLDLHYEGRDTTRTRPEFTSDITLDITCSVEPIDTHPNFIGFAGTRAEPKNGAKFDPRDGRFLFFASEYPEGSEKLNPLAGVRSYNVPVMVVSKTSIDSEWPTENEFNLLGKIIESQTLDNLIPGFGDERNWLYTGIRIRSIGNVYFETTRTAALSGPRKWVDDIYDPLKSRPD